MLQNVMTVTLHLYIAVFKKGCWKKEKLHKQTCWSSGVW